MSFYDKKENAPQSAKDLARQIVQQIEAKYNTVVFDYGVIFNAGEMTDEIWFESMSIFLAGMKPPQNAKLLFYFMIPTNCDDFILNKKGSPTIPHADNWNLDDFLSNIVKCNIQSTKFFKNPDFKGEIVNTIDNLENVDGLRYRVHAFFET